MPLNPASALVQEFMGDYAKVANRLIEIVRMRVEAGDSVRKAVDSVFNQYRPVALLSDALLEGVAAVLSENGVNVSSDLALRKYWLDQTWKSDPVKFSQRTTELMNRAVIVNSVEQGMRQAQGWGRIAEELSKRDLTKGGIAKDIRQLSQLAGRSLGKDTAEYQQYVAQLQSVEKRIAKLAANNAPTERLKVAYQDIIDATKKGSAQAIDKAIENAISAKAAYNAERIARTEMARAYGVARAEKFNADADIVGVRWRLSSRHAITDICDVHAEADLFNLGSGGYPKDQIPEYPAHPHCMCILAPIYKGAPGKYDEEKMTEYLQKQNPTTLKQLLGKKGYEEFHRNPQSWKANLKNYSKPQSLKTLPPAITTGRRNGG